MHIIFHFKGSQKLKYSQTKRKKFSVIQEDFDNIFVDGTVEICEGVLGKEAEIFFFFFFFLKEGIIIFKTKSFELLAFFTIYCKLSSIILLIK